MNKDSLNILVALVVGLGGGNVFGEEARFFRILSPGPTVITACTTEGHVTWTNAVPGLTCTVQVATALAPGNWSDYVQVPASDYLTTHRLFDPRPPSGMVFIPAGGFQMGDSLDGGGWDDPVHTVYVSAFYADQYEVTQELWEDVYSWALTHGYSFEFGAQAKARHHPVQMVTWYDAVKWCNARSEKEGRAPAYYTDAAHSVVYRSGTNDVENAWVNWGAGYRLPTEAEWEKAARGGASGRRFSWADADTIDQSRANYTSTWSGGVPYYSYDVNATSGAHAAFNDGVDPYTSPAGYFAPNGYGLYDTIGNVAEFCWDWDNAYTSAPQTDPRGPASGGSNRVVRGGGWYNSAGTCRVATRLATRPALLQRLSRLGFRTVLPAAQ